MPEIFDASEAAASRGQTGAVSDPDRLQLVLEAIPYPAELVDVAGRVERVNGALAEFAGCSLTATIGRPALELAEVLAGCFADPEAYLRMVRAGVATAETEQEEVFELRSGGWIEQRSHPLGAGLYRGRLVLLVDVTARVAGERREARLSSELVWAQEHERARLASELHQGPIQVVAASLMRLELLLEHADAGTADLGQLVGSLRAELRAAYAELRSLLFGLRPDSLADDGLSAAVRRLLEQLGEQTGIETELDDRLSEPERGEQGLVAFRVLQEALLNVRRHADASHVRVRLQVSDHHLVVEVDDDGRGFDPERPENELPVVRLGLAAMRERVELADGRFLLISRPGAGTRVRFSLPLES